MTWYYIKSYREIVEDAKENLVVLDKMKTEFDTDEEDEKDE